MEDFSLSKAKRRDHITPVVCELHWLPISQRIVHKVLRITFKIIKGYAPSYFSSLLESYKPKCALRSATKRLLIVPKSPTTTYGDRAFSITAPKHWNNLPDSIKYAETVKQFISLVKTCLFKETFD